VVGATEAGDGESINESSNTDSKEQEKRKPETEESENDEELDWGTFYDPKDVFCSEYDCYKILGLDYAAKPSTKEITKNFRSLSRRWHPDKNKKKNAKERFVKIKKAHEILSNKENRKEYDYFRDRPDEYFKKYGSSVIWSYAPKSDARFILFVLFILVSLFTYAAQYQRWKTIANHIVKAAVEDWSTSQGGSVESMEIRQKALEILAKKDAETTNGNSSVTNNKPVSSSNSNINRLARKQQARSSKKIQKEQTNEALKKIVEELVDEIDDFGAGFHKPTMKDLFIVKLLMFPLTIFLAIKWRVKFYARRLCRLPYSTEEVEIMTRMSVGEIGWEAANEKERERMLTLELWVPDNLEEWREEQKIKLLSAGDQKRIARMKKKGKLA